jgi:nicotinate-nucleotide pyrophosphorylase (carboxylating)
VGKEFAQIEWDERLEDDCRHIVRLAVREDLDRSYDWTTVALAPADALGQAAVKARRAGTIVGVRAAEVTLDEMDINAEWKPLVDDGQSVVAGDCVAEIAGSIRDLLTSERLLLNLIGRLSGIATLTRQYVEATGGTKARIYDTRKTTPGWRRLEKYAVRCGGGQNHRTGLFDSVLIKDNHLALAGCSPSEAVRQARQFVHEMMPNGPQADQMIVEVEVDTLDQLDNVLPHGPDIVLLDNMSVDQLRDAVARRDTSNPSVELEASGGISLETVRAIAETGVDRISVGALTHSAANLDVGLDWEQEHAATI